jgi:hypothetical protein
VIRNRHFHFWYRGIRWARTGSETPARGSQVKFSVIHAFASAIGTALLLSGCSEHEVTTAPQLKQPPSHATPTMSALESFFGYMDMPGLTTSTLPSYAAYPEGVKVTITVAGKIHVWSDVNHANYFSKTVDAGPGGVLADGYSECRIAIIVTYGATNFGPQPCSQLTNPPGQLPYDTQGSWTFTAVVQGDGTVWRTPTIPTYTPGECDTIVCHTYEGRQTVEVVPLAGDLDLQAYYALEARSARKALFVQPFTNLDTYAHQTVTFTDSTTPRGLPMQSLTHVWTMMDPTAPPGYWNHTQVPATCTRTNPGPFCPVEIRETGTWTSTVRVNGVPHSDDIVLYCAESEQTLNNDKLRQQLLASLDSSNANDSDFRNRFERYFLVLQDTVTPGAVPYLAYNPRQPTDDVCHGSTVLPGPSMLPPNTKLLGTGHNHPSESFITVKCRDRNGNQTIPASTVYGASKTDMKWQKTVNAAYPSAFQVIIDKHNVYFVRPGASIGAEHQIGNQFNWDGLMPIDGRLKRRCGWPKRIVY